MGISNTKLQNDLDYQFLSEYIETHWGVEEDPEVILLKRIRE